MKFTKIPTNTFKELALNAGVILSEFNPAAPSTAPDDSKILGATNGGSNFSAVPSIIDNGDGIDNCPRNTKELAQCDGWTVKLSTVFVTMNNNLGKKLIAAADIDGTDTTKITPRVDLKDTDFGDIWYVGDYSDKNGATKGGFIAIKIINALSTGGFTLQSANKGKTQFSAEFTGFTSIEDQETVPFELYISAGAAETGG